MMPGSQGQSEGREGTPSRKNRGSQRWDGGMSVTRPDKGTPRGTDAGPSVWLAGGWGGGTATGTESPALTPCWKEGKKLQTHLPLTQHCLVESALQRRAEWPVCTVTHRGSRH